VSEITRPGVETLAVCDCPCCGGSVEAVDCGYASFNPGTAYCRGECKRVWELGYVDSRWDAGVQWNDIAGQITNELEAFSLITVKRRLSISRDFAQEELQEQAAILLQDLKKLIIGAKEQKGDTDE